MNDGRELQRWYVKGSETTTAIWVHDKNNNRVCTVNNAPNDSDVACLIAAAPEMLRALEDMLSGWRYIRETHGDLYGVGWDRAEFAAIAALAKARGRE